MFQPSGVGLFHPIMWFCIQSTNRKVATSRTKPPEKLQLKPSPKKPTKPTASKAGSELSSTDVKVNAEVNKQL